MYNVNYILNKYLYFYLYCKSLLHKTVVSTKSACAVQPSAFLIIYINSFVIVILIISCF